MGKGGSAPPGPDGQQQQHAAGGQHVDAEEHDAAACAALLARPEFQPFQQPSFNAAEFTSKALVGSRTTAQAQSDELRRGVRALEAELHGQVGEPGMRGRPATLAHTRLCTCV